MSEAEHTNNDPAQFSELNESNVGCMNSSVEPSDDKKHGDFDGVKSVLSSFFYSSGEGIPVYSDVGVSDGGYSGDVTNWDVGKCFGEGLNSVQTVGGVFDIFDTGFQGSEQPGMGNNFGNKYTGREADDSNVVSAEQVPVCGGESMSCEPVKDGSEGTNQNENIHGNSLGVIGTDVEEPHYNSCHDATNDGKKVSNCSNEMTGGKSLSLPKVENKTFEPVEVGSWKLIREVAKQCVESVGCIPTECDQNILCHESETGEPSRVLNGVECVKSETAIPRGVLASSVKSDIVSESLNPEDKVVELSTQLHFQKEGPVEEPSKNDHGKHDLLIEPIHASNVVSDSAYFESMKDGVKFDGASKINEEGVPVSVHDKQIEQKENATSEAEQDNACKEQTYVAEPIGKSYNDIEKHSGGMVKGMSTACDDKASLNEQSRQSLQEVGEKVHVIVLGIPATDPTAKPHRFRTPTKANKASEKSRRGRKPGIASATTIKRSPRQPSAASSRVLRSKLPEDPITPESTAILENTQGNSRGRRGRKKREIKGKPDDEFSKMRKHLRYLLHRISYEQNLLDAYSSEGWRGQSLEKLRPEKELQRAKADINRSKVKIRELFHRLDTMSAEGKFPDSLYDSEGLIDSEDIFCAKCGSKDLPAGNDIILCDGNCDRGFHQYCLEPPLQTEEIPPGDEGWFCPACDCKFDCIDLLNDSQGAKLSIEDSWEKVFPESVAAMAGLKQDDMMGLPSDDSEDNDYNPDGQDDGCKDEGKEISSNECDSDESDSSDFSSASEDLGAVCKDEQYLGLPSDDSEDDDFDPDVANANNVDECASSSSEFTSASEDLGATVGNDETSENGQSLPVELDQDLGDSLPLFDKRDVKRLDYKKLFDETYGDAVSDSSDDEEWTDDVATTRRKTCAKREVPVSADGDVVTSADGACPAVTPRRRGRPKRDHKVENGSPHEMQKNPQETSSGGKRGKRPPYNKLPESVTQRLYESFKENKYPDRSTKEKLAGELGLTPSRVDKWFGNARWSLHHHPSRVEASIARVLPGGGTPQTNITVPERGVASSSKLDKGNDGKISTPRKTKKRKEEHDELQTSKIDTSKENETPARDVMDTSEKNITVDSSEIPEAHGRGQRKRRKSSR